MFMEKWIAKEKIVKFSIVVKFNTHTGREQNHSPRTLYKKKVVKNLQ